MTLLMLILTQALTVPGVALVELPPLPGGSNLQATLVPLLGGG